MRRHAILLSLVGVLLLTLSVPAVAKKGGEPGKPPPPDQVELPACGIAQGAGSFEFTAMCEWLPTEPGVWTITASTDATANLVVSLRDSAPGNACAVVDARRVDVAVLTYDFQPVYGTYANTCPPQEGDRIDWTDNDEQFVIWASASPGKSPITISITGPSDT